MAFFKLPALLMAGLITTFASSSANASLIVEQFDDFWSADIVELVEYANSNSASSITEWDYIDFTDYPSGFSGDVAGNNLWPSALSVGDVGYSNEINDTFFVKVTGLFDAKDAGDYYFQTYSDDGVFLFVDGKMIINDPTLHGVQRRGATASLDVGVYDIELFFFEKTGWASLEFTYSTASSSTLQLVRGVSGTILDKEVSNQDVPAPMSSLFFAAGLLGLASRRFSRSAPTK